MRRGYSVGIIGLDTLNVPEVILPKIQDVSGSCDGLMRAGDT